MSEIKGKVLGLVFFVFLIFLLAFLIMNTRKPANKNIRLIEIEGNKLLSEKDYLAQAKLDNKSEYSNLTLGIIKDRIEKHPYVKNADVEFYKNNHVRIYLTEKKMMAVLVSSSNPLFISDNFELLPVLPKTKVVDLPVITNPDRGDTVKLYSFVKGEDITQGLKIIDACKLVDNKFFKYLSEINLREGGDIVINFSGLKPTVIFGRYKTAAKVVYLKGVLDYLTSNNSVNNISYIDLRFSNKVYLGENQGTGVTE